MDIFPEIEELYLNALCQIKIPPTKHGGGDIGHSCPHFRDQQVALVNELRPRWDPSETAGVHTLGMSHQYEAVPGPAKVGWHPFYVFRCRVAMINLLNLLIIILIWLEKILWAETGRVCIYLPPTHHTHTHTHKTCVKTNVTFLSLYIGPPFLK